MPAESQTRSKISVLRADVLEEISWIVHGFSARPGGVSSAYGGNVLNLGFTDDDDRKSVERNRELFKNEIGAADWPLVTLGQAHSDRIFKVETAAQEMPGGDGMITATTGILLGIKTADCLPILVADREKRTAAAVHAGWRGTLARIAEKAIGEMRKEFGSSPQDLVAAIGPGIHVCCYAVGEEVREKFESQFSYAQELFREGSEEDAVRRLYPLMFMNQRAPGHGSGEKKMHLDLVEANRRQLLAAGLQAANIEASEFCTACRTDIFFSHRAEQGKTGRMMAVIGIKPN